jgi:hypothetical protein
MIRAQRSDKMEQKKSNLGNVGYSIQTVDEDYFI